MVISHTETKYPPWCRREWSRQDRGIKDHHALHCQHHQPPRGYWESEEPPATIQSCVGVLWQCSHHPEWQLQ